MTESYRTSPGVLTQEVNGELVLLDLEQDHYFGLDETGMAVWRLLELHLEMPELLNRLSEEFDTDMETLESDVRQLMKQLSDAGLLIMGDVQSE